MPKGIYKNLLCREEREKDFIPLSRQVECRDKFIKSPHKGLLLYQGLGSGKTCTSIIIGDYMLEKKMIDKVYILTQGSLRQTWINEYCTVCGKDWQTMDENYIFITYNYNITEIPDFDKSLVVIDEVHNFINAVKNFSKTITLIYDKLYRSKCRILALSGTPVYNYFFEFPLLGRLLKPGVFPDIRVNDEIKDELFTSLFRYDDIGNLIPINKTVLKNKLEGIIAYYPNTEDLPEVINIPVIKCMMSLEQASYYWQRDAQERTIFRPTELIKNKDPKLYETLKKLYIMAKKNILTRSASNFYYDDEYIDKKDDIVKNGGWVDKDVLKNNFLKIHSMKIVKFLILLTILIDEKHLLFTFFKEKSGVYLLKALLDTAGVKSEIFSGDLTDSQRKRVLKRFNSPKNRYGKDIKILLVTEAGAEGISTMEVQNMHILESSPRVNKIVQAIGRVVRRGSHKGLPENERMVRVWRYWSINIDRDIDIDINVLNGSGEKIKSKRHIPKESITIDQYLYEKGEKTRIEINSFLEILKSNSILKD